MKNKECENKKCHMTSIGGQAVMEGGMMRGPKDIAIAVVKAVKSCDVAKAQELEKKVADYKKGLYEHEIVEFDKAFNKRINDPEEGLKKEDMDKFDEAVYVWFHPLEKLVCIDIEEKPAEKPAEAATVE